MAPKVFFGTTCFLLLASWAWVVGVLVTNERLKGYADSLVLYNKQTQNNDQSTAAGAAASSVSVSSSRYAVAASESMGFFNDIEEQLWMHLKKRVHKEPYYVNTRNPDQNLRSNPALWMLENVDPVFTCPYLQRVGGRGDGPKWVCDPHRLATQHTEDCLIYSFGSAGNYRFEDGMIDILQEANSHNKSNNSTHGGGGGGYQNHCEIHVFDPNPKFARRGDAETKNIHYHAWALKSSYKNTKHDLKGALSLPEIMQRLGHTNRRIDIFKVDCEGCEWTMYKDMLPPPYSNVDIRQILIETHMGLDVDLGSQFYNDLRQAGFVPFSKEANTHPKATPGMLFEFGFVRLHPDFFKTI